MHIHLGEVTAGEVCICEVCTCEVRAFEVGIIQDYALKVGICEVRALCHDIGHVRVTNVGATKECFSCTGPSAICVFGIIIHDKALAKIYAFHIGFA